MISERSLVQVQYGPVPSLVSNSFFPLLFRALLAAGGCQPLPSLREEGEAVSSRRNSSGGERLLPDPRPHRGSGVFRIASRAKWSNLFFFFRDGNIAQLVEHCLCKAGAKGSNPFISTLLHSSVSSYFSTRCLHLGEKMWIVEFLGRNSQTPPSTPRPRRGRGVEGGEKK